MQQFSTSRAARWLSAAILILPLAGCGGGGGGPSSSSAGDGDTSPGGNPTPGAPTPTPAPTAPPVTNATLLADEFNSGSFDRGKWSTYDGSSRLILDRTQYGNEPEIRSEGGTGFARLRLDSYNPSRPGTHFLSTEMLSRLAFTAGNVGVEFETRLRAPNLPGGLVAAFFTYGERGVWPDSYSKEEIDFEFITNFPRNQLWLNVWNDWNIRYGYNDGVHTRETRTTVNGLNWSGWNVYKIRWLPNAVEYYANNALVRRETNVVPDDPMQLHLNLWAADSSWPDAYSANINPTSNPNNNTSYHVDVDYVRVRALGSGARAVTTRGGAPEQPHNARAPRSRPWRG